MFDSIVSSVMSFIMGSFFDLHTYVGIFLGVVFAPMWVKVWSWLKALVVKKDPAAATIVTEVQDVADAVIADIKPAADAVVVAVDSQNTPKLP